MLILRISYVACVLLNHFNPLHQKPLFLCLYFRFPCRLCIVKPFLSSAPKTSVSMLILRISYVACVLLNHFNSLSQKLLFHAYTSDFHVSCVLLNYFNPLHQKSLFLCLYFGFLVSLVYY